MNPIAAVVADFQRASEALAALDFQPALQRWLEELGKQGKKLEGCGVDPSLPDFALWVQRFYRFQVSVVQTSPEGLLLDFYSREAFTSSELAGAVEVPWWCFSTGEPSVTEASQQFPAKSHIATRVQEYCSSRGIPMPVYHDGSKVTEEAQELRDAIRTHLAAPSEATLAHLKEEVADVAITAGVAAHQFGFTVEEALEVKIAKDRGRGVKR